MIKKDNCPRPQDISKDHLIQRQTKVIWTIIYTTMYNVYLQFFKILIRMAEVIKVFMNPETLTTLEDHFIDDKKKKTLHRFFYESLRGLARDSKVADETRKIIANVIVDEQVQQETFQYKDLKLEEYVLVSDPNWRPEDLEPTETVAFEMKIGDKTHKHLVNYCRIYGIRLTKFNESIPTTHVMEKGVMVEKPDPRYKSLPMASCFEEVVHKALSDPIQNLLSKSAEDLFDKEFDEIEKEAVAS